MEPILALNTVVKVRTFCSLNSQLGINVRHYQVNSVAGDVTPTDLADMFDTLWAPLYKPMMPAAAQYRGIGVTFISPLPASIEYYSNDQAGQGTASGNPMPAQVCGMLSYRTNLAGKKNRGRNYIPFPAAVFASIDETPSAAYTALGAALGDAVGYADYDGGADNAALQLIVYPGASPLTRAVQAVVFRDKWATQRRRGDYGQGNEFPI